MSFLAVLPPELVLNVQQDVEIAAPIGVVFESLLEQMGPGGETPDGAPMPMTLEAWPGGRWFRDLGESGGHLWGHVQVIKPPKLLEITGPLFMSYPVISHVQYRLTEQNGSTILALTHRAMGDISSDHRQGVATGWGYILGKVRERAEK